MTDVTQDPWSRDSTWEIVGTDLDLEHVFAAQTRITFKLDDGGFKVVAVSPTEIAECFENTFLRLAGSVPPTLEDVEGVDTLANFNARSAVDRSNILDRLAQHVDPKKELLRLEGMISMLCHATDAQLAAPPSRKPHSPLQLETKICVYQIKDPGANAPFLLVRAPSSPGCPRNGDGTALGQS